MSDTEVTLPPLPTRNRQRRWITVSLGHKPWEIGDFMLTIRQSRSNISEGHDPTERTRIILAGRLKVRTNRANAKANRRWLFVNVGLAKSWAKKFERVEVGRFGITVKQVHSFGRRSA